MKAEELRIGNWVYSQEIGENLQISAISEDGFSFKDCVTWDYPNIEEIHPIPLTEEILLKCGFEINGKYYRSKYIQDSIKLIYDFNQRVLYFKYKGDFSPMIQIPRAIESLHKLQNIYYTLTDE